MTISTLVAQTNYAGDGATTVFPTTFKFIKNEYVKASLWDTASNTKLADWTEGTQYTLTGAGLENGGTLTVSTTPTDYTPQTGQTLVIALDITQDQQAAFEEGGPLPSDVLETALDKLTQICQQISQNVGRALRVPQIVDTVIKDFPAPEAGLFVRGNQAEDGWENADVTGQGAIGLPLVVGEGGTGATTAAGARTNLELNVQSQSGLTHGTGGYALNITDQAAVTTPQKGDEIALHDIAPSPVRRKMTLENLGKVIADLTEKSQPVASDSVWGYSVADGAARRFPASPFFEYGESSLQAWSSNSGGSITLASIGLTGKPRGAQIQFEATAAFAGYSIGDVIATMDTQSSPADNHGFGVWYDGTNIGWSIGTNGIFVIPKSGGTLIEQTSSGNFSLRLTAWR